MLKKISIVALMVLILNLNLAINDSAAIGEDLSINMAIQFNNHAASAYVSQDKGWFKEEGLDIASYESYVTGMALASAMKRGDISVSYMCLVPAITLYANAGVPIKVVSGAHRHGFGLVVNSEKITTLKDLEKPGMRIGCVSEGGPVDVLLHKMIEKFSLDKSKIISNINRMNPPLQLLALQAGRLDAIFVPEQWATMAEESSFTLLVQSQDIWPDLQGSVLVVKRELLEKSPEIVSKLVRITEQSIDWINNNLTEAAEIVARQLSCESESILSSQVDENINSSQLIFLSNTLFKSMKRIEYTTDIDPVQVQATIDFLAELGYIKNTFPAKEILDLKFLTE